MTIYASRAGVSMAMMAVVCLSGCVTDPSNGPSNSGAEVAEEPYALFRKAKQAEARGSAFWLKDKATARKHYASYRDLTEKVTKLLPDEPAYKSEHILACIKYADCCWHLGDVDEAMSFYTNAYDRLTSDPAAKTDRKWRHAALGLIAAQVVMGDRSMADGKYKHAEDCFTVGRNMARTWQDTAPLHPAASQSLCWTLLKLTDACVLQTKYDLARRYLLDADSIANGEIDITGRIFHTKEGAIKSIRETRSQLSKLQAVSDADATRVKADTFHMLGVRAMHYQDWAIMYAYLKCSIALREPLLKEGDRELRTRQMVTMSQCAVPAGLLKRQDEARELHASALALAEELLAQKKESIVLSDMAQTLSTWALLEEKTGNMNKAEDLYGRALKALETLEKDGDVTARDRRALMFLRKRQDRGFKR